MPTLLQYEVTSDPFPLQASLKIVAVAPDGTCFFANASYTISAFAPLFRSDLRR